MKNMILITIILITLCFSSVSGEENDSVLWSNDKFAFGIRGDDILTPFDKLCVKYWFNQKHGVEFIFDGSIRDSSLWRYYDFNQLYRWIYRFNKSNTQFLFTGLGLIYDIDLNYYEGMLNSKTIKTGLNNFIGCEYFVAPKISLLLELTLSTTWARTTGISKLAAKMIFVPYFGVFIYF